MSKKTPPKSPPLTETHHTRSEKLRDAERPTSGTLRADAQVETAEAGDDSAVKSSTLPQDDASAKVGMAVTGEPAFGPTGDADKDGAIAKSDEGHPYDSAVSRGGEDSATCPRCGEAVNSGSEVIRHAHRHIREDTMGFHHADVLKQDTVTVGPYSPGERNTEAVNALSNAPPYLLSRAETLYMAHCHAMEGEVRVPFPNLRPVERAAWLASAKSTEP